METNSIFSTTPSKQPPLESDHIHHNQEPQPNSSLLISVPILVSIALVLLFGLLLFVTLRRFKYMRSKDCTDEAILTSTIVSFNNKSNSNASQFDLSNASPDVGSCMHGSNSGRARFPGGQVFTYRELEIATDGFNRCNVLGNGGFGVVYKGVLSDGTVSAIKVLNREGKQGEREFRAEVDLLSRLRSSYLVELLGYCADQQHRILVFEFMPNGSLQHHLHPTLSSRSRVLDWTTRLRIALDCARALEFLHERTSPVVIHRDFKCSNILLDHKCRAKVSDFGMAKIGSDKINGQVLTRVLGTSGYVAPEYASTGKLTTKSDVYSYGVVLLELLTGRSPVDSTRPPGEQSLVSWWMEKEILGPFILLHGSRQQLQNLSGVNHFLVSQALPRLTNREKVMEMVDPALQGQYSKKDLVQSQVSWIQGKGKKLLGK
ncbi:Proline-rich receptor-like protein kinase PERK8 [Acorus gramineus]|uniref:Proline-rich receptor-like protein kinase PERK8 n=1 Tax=Acorus gramineus TaxID=55184 RepID=A0AAV9BL68_ACOGR|nr:Proline-rich receptor-like protein kinase PERK8 [Acorus gramineus]